MYPVIGLPLSDPGVNFTDAAGPTHVTNTFVGAAGYVTVVVNAPDGTEYGPVPTSFVAFTAHEYVFPIVNPVN